MHAVTKTQHKRSNDNCKARKDAKKHITKSEKVQKKLQQTVRIYHECEGGIEKNCPEDHQLASQGMPSDDKGWSRGMEFSIKSSHE